MSRRVRRSRLSSPQAHLPYAEFEFDLVCPTPEMLEEIRRVVGEPRVVRPRALPEVGEEQSLAEPGLSEEALSSGDDGSAGSGEAEENADVENADEENAASAEASEHASADEEHAEISSEHAASSEAEEHAATSREHADPHPPEQIDTCSEENATPGPQEGSIDPQPKSVAEPRLLWADDIPSEEEGDGDAVAWLADHKPRLRQPYTPAPAEVAALEWTANPEEHEGEEQVEEESEEARLSREAEIELELCLAEEQAPPARPPPKREIFRRVSEPEIQGAVAPPAPVSPIPTWAELRLRHDTGSRRKPYNTRRELQISDYVSVVPARRTPPPEPRPGTSRDNAGVGRSSETSSTSSRHRSDETAMTSGLELRRSRHEPPSLPLRLEGVMFGGLKTVPTDPEVDPPAHTCFNCWQPGHGRRTCPLRRRIAVFCINCGRREVDISQCPRCSERYRERQERWEDPLDDIGSLAPTTRARPRDRQQPYSTRERQASADPSRERDADRRRQRRAASPQRPRTAEPTESQHTQAPVRPLAPVIDVTQDISVQAIDVMRFTTQILEDTRSLPPDLRVRILRAAFRGKTECMGIGRTTVEGPRMQELSRQAARRRRHGSEFEEE